MTGEGMMMTLNGLRGIVPIDLELRSAAGELVLPAV